MIEVNHLTVVTHEQKTLLNNLSFRLKKGEIVGLTGESGSGKTTFIKTIMGLTHKSCRIKDGNIIIDDKDVTHFSTVKRRALCGTTIGFIPQNPMTSFDRQMKIDKQMIETFCIRLGISKKEALRLAVKKLLEVNLKDTSRVLTSYPTQLSGGMLQRIAVAMILGLNPRYILADEPTSALDEANRDIILEVLKKKSKEIGVLIISHDIFTLDNLCKKVWVMEKGQWIERGTMQQLLQCPQKSWTKKFANAYVGVDGSDWEWKAL